MAFDLERAAAWTTVLDRWCREQPELSRTADSAMRSSATAAAARRVGGGVRRRHPRAGAPARGGLRLSGGALPARRAASPSRRIPRRGGPLPTRCRVGMGTSARSCAAPHRRRAHAARADDDPPQRRGRRCGHPSTPAAGPGRDRARGGRHRRRPAGAGRTPRRRAVAHPVARRYVAARGGPDAARRGRRCGALERGARRSAAAWAALAAPYEVARCRVVSGRILRDSASPRASAELDAARAAFLELGARSGLAELAC